MARAYLKKELFARACRDWYWLNSRGFCTWLRAGSLFKHNNNSALSRAFIFCGTHKHPIRVNLRFHVVFRISYVLFLGAARRRDELLP